MGSSRRAVSVYSLVAEVCLHALLVAIPFSLGGAAPWVLWPLVGLSSAALVAAVVGARRQRQDLLVAPAALVPALVAALCLLQLVPLPAGLLQLLSAPAAELRSFALVPLGLERARPVSLDPPSTWRELAKHLSYLFALAAAVQVSRSRTVRRRLLGTAALTGVALSLVGLGHKLASVDKLFGFHAWTYAGPRLVTPFANHNHLAGFLTLAGTLTLGLAVTARERSRALLWSCAFVTCAVGTVFSFSRGGLMSFTVAPLMFAALLVRQKMVRAQAETGGSPARSWLWTALPLAAVVAAAGVGGLIAWETLSERLATVSTLERLGRTKVELWPMLAQGARAFPVLGMGRGAFELAFTPWQTTLASVVFTHPENVALQLLAELGVLGALAVAALGALALWRILKRPDSHALELAAVAGVLGVVLHDVFDFALELPATAVAAAVVLGAASRGEKDEGSRLPVRAAAAVGTALVALAAVAAFASRPDFHAAEAKLGALVRQGGQPAAVNALARALVDRHPSDYALYALAARAHSRRDGNPQEALAWVNRVLTLRPLDAGAHLDAARALLKLGKRGQALLEYRFASEAGGDGLNEGLKYARTPDEALQLVDFAPPALGALVAALHAHRRSADADQVLARALSQLGARSDAAPLWLVHADRRLEAKDAAGALASLGEAEKRGADALAVARARARVLGAEGKADEALGVLQAQVARHPEDVELAFSISDALARLGRTRQAREALTRVSPFVGDPQQRARMMVAEAGLHEADRAWARAVSSYQSAARLAPGWSAPHYQAARLYEGMGKYDAAAREVHEGIRADGPGAALAQAPWLERLSKAQADQQEKLLEAPAEDGR